MPPLGASINDILLASITLAHIVSGFFVTWGVLMLLYASTVGSVFTASGAHSIPALSWGMLFGKFSLGMGMGNAAHAHILVLALLHGSLVGAYCGWLLERWRWAVDSAISSYVLYLCVCVAVHGMPSSQLWLALAAGTTFAVLVARQVGFRAEMADVPLSSVRDASSFKSLRRSAADSAV